MSEIEQSSVAADLGANYDKFSADEAKTEVPVIETPETTPEVKEVEKPEPEISLYAKDEKVSPEKPVVTETGLKPPSSWTVEAKARFNALDPIIQQEVLKRETDFHKGQEQYKTGYQHHQEFEKAIGPYMPTIQALGATPIQAVQYLLNADHQLRYGAPHQKAAYFQQLAQQYGIDINSLSQEQPQVDPHVAMLQAKIAQMENNMLQGANQQTQAVQHEANSEIQNFQNDPKNIYFEDVREDMSVLLQAGRAKDLADAYDKACRANDKIYPLLLQQKQKEEEGKRIEEAKRKAADAKRAGFDVKGTGSVDTGDSDLSLRQQLERAFG